MSTNRRNFIKVMGAAGIVPLLPAASFANDVVKNNNIHRILCCNIRVALDEDETKGFGWKSRKDICLSVIKKRKPSIICLQEVLKVQAADFRDYFSGFQLVGFDGPEMDAFPNGYHGIAKNPILFDKERYELQAAGTYWLSETPLVAGSKSWDTARARHANWVRLREKKTGREFRVVNLHLDHVSGKAKTEQARMVAVESAQYQGPFPQILTGDFNTKFDSVVLNSIRENNWSEAWETLHGKKEAGFTGHEFQGMEYSKGPSKGRIDFIWCRGNAKAVAAEIVRDSVKGKYPSDHFFMQADIQL